MNSGRLVVKKTMTRTGERIHWILGFSVLVSVWSDFWNYGEAPVGTTRSS